MPYVTRNGRRMKRSAGATNGRQHCVSLEGTVAVFECEQGHKQVKDFSKGPVSKRITSTDILKKFAVYWGLGTQKNGTRGHCYGWCQRCQNDADGLPSAAEKRAQRSQK